MAQEDQELSSEALASLPGDGRKPPPPAAPSPSAQSEVTRRLAADLRQKEHGFVTQSPSYFWYSWAQALSHEWLMKSVQ